MSHIIIMGNPVDGFDFIGPFSTNDDALSYAEADGSVRHSDWWVSELIEGPDTDTDDTPEGGQTLVQVLTNAAREVLKGYHPSGSGDTQAVRDLRAAVAAAESAKEA